MRLMDGAKFFIQVCRTHDKFIGLDELAELMDKTPTVEAIPIDWLRMWFTKKASLIGITLMSEIETEWEKENEQNDN